MHVRHRAWLSAVPDHKNNGKQNERTRYEILKDKQSELITLPEIEYGEWIIEYLMEIGPAGSNGMGLCPICYTEINAWINTTKTEVSPWDVNMIRHLSRVYVSQYNDSKDKNAPAPYHYTEKSEEEIRTDVVKGFKQLVKMKRKK